MIETAASVAVIAAPFATAGSYALATGFRELCRYKIAKLDHAIELERMRLPPRRAKTSAEAS